MKKKQILERLVSDLKPFIRFTKKEKVTTESGEIAPCEKNEFELYMLYTKESKRKPNFIGDVYLNNGAKKISDCLGSAGASRFVLNPKMYQELANIWAKNFFEEKKYFGLIFYDVEPNLYKENQTTTLGPANAIFAKGRVYRIF